MIGVSPIPQRFICTLIIFLCVAFTGCASRPKPAAASDAAARTASSSAASASERLLQLAKQEESASRQPSGKPSQAAHVPPPPPGIDPAALAPRAADDPRAHLQLDQAMARFAERFNQALHPINLNQAQVDPDRQAEATRLYTRGRLAALDGRIMQALVELQKARELDPASPEILREMARCCLAEDRIAQAVEIFEQLLTLEPDNQQALFTVGLAFANRRDFERSASILSRLVHETSPIDTGSQVLAYFTLGIALRELGYDRASIEASLRTVEIPEQLIAEDRSARLASVYRQRGETWRSIGDAYCRLTEHSRAASAYAIASQLPSGDPSSIAARLIYANLCLQRPYSAHIILLQALTDDEQISEREISLCAYLRQHGGPLSVLSEAVRERYRQRADDSALLRAAASLLPAEEGRDLLREFVGRNPRDLRSVMQLFEWVAQRDVTAAVDLLVSLVEQQPDLADDYVDRLLLAVPRSDAILTAVRSLTETPARAQVETKLLWKAGGLGEAWSACTAARQRWPEDRVLALQQIKLAAVLQEHVLFDAAVASSPPMDDVGMLLDLSQAHRLLGRTDRALEIAEQALAMDPKDNQARTEVARALVAEAAANNGDAAMRVQVRAWVDQARDLIAQVIEAEPRRDDAYEVLTIIYGPGGVLADTNLLRETLQKLRNANPQSPLYVRWAAQESINQKRFEQAVERLIGLYESDPADIASLTLAVSAWQQWGRLDAAEQWLKDRLAQRPGDAALLEQWVRVQLMMNRADAVIAELEARAQSSGNEFVVRRLLETVYRAGGQMHAAMELGERRLLARPEGIRREIELAALYAGAELAGRSLDHLQWVLDHADQATLEELGGALRVASRIQGDERRRDEINLALVNRTLERFLDAPLQIYGAGLRALAQADALDDEFDDLANRAASHSRDVSEKTASAAAAWRDLAQALIDVGEPAAAARALRAPLRQVEHWPDDALAMLARFATVAGAAAELKDETEAHAQQTIELLQFLSERGRIGPLLEEQDESVLAQALYEASVIYTIIGAKRGGDLLVEQSLQLRPDHPMSLNNLGYSRLEQGAHDQHTIDLIEKAYVLLPKDPNILDTVGWLRYKQGQFSDQTDESGQQKPGALGLIQQSMGKSQVPSPEVIDHLGDVQWRLGNTEAATAAWRQVVKLLEETNYRQLIIQNMQVQQAQVWQLVVVDPRTLYDREYGSILARAKSKLEAVANGEQPAVAPVFEESSNQDAEQAE